MAVARSVPAGARVAAVVALAAALLTGCTGRTRTVALAAPTPAPPLTVSAEPVATGDVAPSTPAHVSTSGVLESIRLTNSDGHQVPGVVSADRHVWTASAHLEFGATYIWSGIAVAGRQRLPVTGTFTTTAAAAKLEGARMNIGDGETVGVAAPIIVQFAGTVRNKAAVQRALSVSTSIPTEGSWAWLPDTSEGSRIHWRPKNYWAPGTSVNVAAHLYGVPYGDGAFGRQDLTLHFTIGRAQIVKADAASHQVVVIRDGQQVASYAASYGLDSSIDRSTRSGTHIVMEKDQAERMVSQKYHYDLTEYWAVRISNNGEFIHANPASASAQGNSNVTHGCINLSTADAQTYFDSAVYGDPVEVTNTGVSLGADDGDIYDWTIPWNEWQRMSA